MANDPQQETANARIARQNELTEESVAQLNSVSKGIFGIIGAVKEDTQKNKEFMKGQTERLKGFFGKGIIKFIPKSSKEDNLVIKPNNKRIAKIDSDIEAINPKNVFK